MRKTLLVFTTLICTFISFSQTVDIIGNPSTSASSALASNLYAVNESIYTETEIGINNFTTPGTAIDKIGFNVAAVGSATNFALVKIYMMEVPLGTTTMVTGAYSLSGYTQVFGGAGGGSVILPSIGFTEIALSTPFVRTSGKNLQVLIERTDNTSHGGFFYNTANGNNSSGDVLSGRRYNNVSPLSSTTSLFASVFRAQIRLKHEFANDAAVLPIYSLGKLPINNAVPHIISTTILNNGANTITALPITLTITGANSFADVQTITSLAPGASAIINFAAFTASVTGTNTISVTIPADDDNTNNNSTIQQIINVNTWSYSQGNINTGTAGINNNTIDLAAKYFNSSATFLSQAAVYFLANGQPYKLTVWDGSGVGGTPGNVLFETTLLSSVAGQNMVPILPALSLPVGNFYIGVKQTTTNNFNLLRQTESPLRTNTFYFSSPSGTAWVDNATRGTNRFMLDPKLRTPVDAFVTKMILPNAGAATCSSSNETISAEILNVGANSIAANAAVFTLKIAGANPQILQTTNAGVIGSGATAMVSFSGVNLINPGINFDTVYVSLPGDAEPLNDTAYKSQTIAAINVLLETVVNTYLLTARCDDLGWTYYNDESQKSVLAVEWGGNAAAKAAAVASLTLDATIFSATTGNAASAKGTFTMKRYWNINVGSSQPTTPVKVRFFYDASEKNATDVAASNFQSANPGSVIKTPAWFKTNSGAYTADAANVSADAVINASQLTDVNTAGNTVNNVLYAQFNNITSFSGGTYAAGVGTTSVLPVSIEYFRGSKQGDKNILNWKISCIGNPFLTIILERSTDGKKFNKLTEQTETEFRCLQAFTQNDVTPMAGLNYYRIVTITPDGKKLYSNIVWLLNKKVGFKLIGLAPNPVKDNAVINIAAAKAGIFVLKIMDMQGTEVFKNAVNFAEGNNVYKLDFSGIALGLYVLQVVAVDGETQTVRFVKY